MASTPPPDHHPGLPAARNPASSSSPSSSPPPPPPALALSQGVSRKSSLPPSFFKFPARKRLKAIQQYIGSFEYRQSPQASFNCQKSRPLACIMDTAKLIIHNPQPIKCVEAVFLAIYLTAGITDTERIPLGFKSELHGQVYQHIVLLVRHNGKFGAFGISRQHNLMSKGFDFDSISSIVDEFQKAYKEYEHKVLRIRVGLPVEHNIESPNFVCWRHLSLDPSSTPWEQCSEALKRHANQGKRLWERWLVEGQRQRAREEACLKKVEMVGTQENSAAATAAGTAAATRKLSECHSDSSSGKTFKRKQQPESQCPDVTILRKRHALRELRSSVNISGHGLICDKAAMKGVGKAGNLPSSKKPSTEVFLANAAAPARRCSRCHRVSNEAPLTRKKKMIAEMPLEGHSLELFFCKKSTLHRHQEKVRPRPRERQDKRKTR